MTTWTGKRGCYNCPKKCHNVISWPGRKRFSYKCYGKDTYHMAAFQELDFSYDILGVAQEYGVDSYSTPQVMAFALELLEAGILTGQGLSRNAFRHSRADFSTSLKKLYIARGLEIFWPMASIMRRVRLEKARKHTIIIPSKNSSSCPSS